MRKVFGIILVFLFIFINVDAQEKNKADNSEIKFSCKQYTGEESKYFKDIQIEAKKINKSICDMILLVPTHETIAEIAQQAGIPEFGAKVRELSSFPFLQKQPDNFGIQLDYFEETLKTGVIFPILFINDPMLGEAKYFYFTGNQLHQGELPANEKDCKSQSIDKSCRDVLEDLKGAIYPYQININSFTAFETRVKLTSLANDWDSYFESGRAQTFTDIAITTLIERNHFKKDYLVGPPERQWFVFHPNLVIESVSAAPDGNNIEPALSIEWIGVNWWRESPIGIPLGLSLTSLYSDRPGVDDIGHGVALHIDNKYTIGWANHGGDNGFYVSMDLLKLVDDKKKQVKRYREKIKDLRN